MILKPQDVVIVLKLVAMGGKGGWSYSALAGELSVSVSETHAGIRRASAARLLDDASQGPRRLPVEVSLRKNAIEEFLFHGVKYAFPPDRGEATRGMATGYAAPFFAGRIAASPEYPPVWPHPEGAAKGYAFSPPYKSVPKAAAKDAKLYEMLALLDAIRDGRAREREIAEKDLRLRLRKGW